jgi:hypothetical protein
MAGVLAMLAIPTLLPSGAKGLTVTRTSGAISDIEPATGNEFQLIEPEDGTCNYLDNLTVGVTRFRKHGVGFKYAGNDDATNVGIQALCLYRHTFLLKLKNGKCVIVGENNGLIAEQDNGGSGGGDGELSGHDVVLTGGEIVHAAEVPLALFDELAAAVAD